MSNHSSPYMRVTSGSSDRHQQLQQQQQQRTVGAIPLGGALDTARLYWSPEDLTNVVSVPYLLMTWYFITCGFSIGNYVGYFRFHSGLYGDGLLRAYLAFVVIGTASFVLFSSVLWLWAAKYSGSPQIRSRRLQWGVWVMFLLKDLPMFIMECNAIVCCGWQDGYQGFVFVVQCITALCSFAVTWLSFTWRFAGILQMYYGFVSEATLKTGLEQVLIFSPQPPINREGSNSRHFIPSPTGTPTLSGYNGNVGRISSNRSRDDGIDGYSHSDAAMMLNGSTPSSPMQNPWSAGRRPSMYSRRDPSFDAYSSASRASVEPKFPVHIHDDATTRYTPPSSPLNQPPYGRGPPPPSTDNLAQPPRSADRTIRLRQDAQQQRNTNDDDRVAYPLPDVVDSSHSSPLRGGGTVHLQPLSRSPMPARRQPTPSPWDRRPVPLDAAGSAVEAFYSERGFSDDNRWGPSSPTTPF